MSVDSGMSNSAKFITVGDRPRHPFNIFWHPRQPDRIHMATGDPAFVDEDGGKPGVRVVFSSNPRSVDYNPATFNRLARALKRPALRRRMRCRCIGGTFATGTP